MIETSGARAPAAAAPDLAAYRSSVRERQRTASLLSFMPVRGETALDVGAREGFLSLFLADRFRQVTALDLRRPHIDHPSVRCVEGDVCKLPFEDGAFDLVLCAEVLEHIPPAHLRRACAELARVTRRHLLIGVPYRQDTRVGRTLCGACGRRNPPWGHVNVFDEGALEMLFPALTAERTGLVGETRDRTNALAAWLDDRAGNPYGTYGQDEACVHCGAALAPPEDRRSLAQRACGFASHWLTKGQRAFSRPQPTWIHVLYHKPARQSAPPLR